MTIPELFEHAVTTLKALQRIEAQNVLIIQYLAKERWRERSKTAQELRRLRELVAKLEAEKGVRVALTEELQRVYGEPQSHSHESAVKRDFRFSKNKKTK